MKKSLGIDDRFFYKDDCLHLSALKEAGFDAVDYSVGWGVLLKDNCEDKIEKVRLKLEETGIECYQIHLPCYNIFLQPDATDEATEKSIHRALEVAACLGTKWAVVHSMGTVDAEHSAEWVISRNVENFRRYLETAEECGVGIALENIPRFGDCPQYDFITASVERHLEIIERIDSPNFQACWDFGHQHLNISDGDRVATLGRIAKYVKAFHMASNYGNMDWHLAPCFGNVNWREILRPVTEAGYDGTFNLELNLSTIPEEVMPYHYRLYSRMLDEIIEDIRDGR